MSTHLYLDIDGVLVTEPTPPFPQDFRPHDVRVADGRFVPVAYSEAILSTLAQLLDHESLSITTASSWEADAPYLFREIGLPESPWLDLTGLPGETMFDRKHRAVLAHAREHGPQRILWIDDHLPKSMEERAELARSLPVDEALLISPIAKDCLTPAHLALIADFLSADSSAAAAAG